MTTQRFLISILLLALIAVCTSAARGQSTTDEEAIRRLVGEYIKSWREADVERLAELFEAEEGRVMWVSQESGGQVLKSMTFGEILQRQRRPQPEYGLRWKVLYLDVIDGKLAVSKVIISRSGGSYIDLLLWQKIGGGWKMVAKNFVVRSEAAENP